MPPVVIQIIKLLCLVNFEKEKVMIINSLDFSEFVFNSRKQILIGIDKDKKYCLKIEVVHNKNKANDIKGEYDILSHLNSSGCRTCPKVFEFGSVNKDYFYLKTKEKTILDQVKQTEFSYILQEYIPDSGDHSMGDILLALIEQKNLGVYQGDVKPENLRFDPKTNLCYLIDYDQAILLDNKQKNLGVEEFLFFCSEYDRKKYNVGNWLRHFPHFSEYSVSDCLHEGALDLKNTTIFNAQKTTNSISGIYHTIKSRDIFIQGSRQIDARAALLDQCDFFEGEKTLDIGCNAGLLSMYLHDRGCTSTGVDNDPYIVIAAKIVSNILGKNISYHHLDLDRVEELEEFDTIMLFSVIHHTRKVVANAIKVAKSCSRIFLEARLIESGKQPYGEKWIGTSNWSFNNIQELVYFCEKLFPEFKMKRNLGQVDKGRYILEFTK